MDASVQWLVFPLLIFWALIVFGAHWLSGKIHAWLVDEEPKGNKKHD